MSGNLSIILSIISLVTSLLVSSVALLVSIRTSRSQQHEAAYSDIDGAYFKILHIGIEHPELRNSEKTRTYFELPAHDQFRLSYESYAYMCMNVMETIFDREQLKKSKFGVSPTWLPVILEENALHICWFCRNLRLFKGPFQRFIMTQINQLTITDGTLADLDEVYARMQRDFPSSELKSRPQFERLMARAEYKLYLARHTAAPDAKALGYAFVFEPQSPKLAWLDYIAIDPTMRNAGYGSTFFNTLCERLKRGQRRGMLLEVEPPTSEEPETLAIQQRRIAFYKRIGAQQLDTEYLFPGGDEPLPLLLFYRSLDKADVLHKQSIVPMIRAVYNYIHDDVEGRDDILGRFIGKITDSPLGGQR